MQIGTIEGVIRLKDEMGPALKKAEADLASTGKAAQKTTGGIAQLTGGFRAMQSALAALAVGVVVKQIYDLGAAAVQASIQLQAINNTLRAATGSVEAAGEAYGFVQAEAQRLGLDLATSAKQFGQLSAAARGTVLEGQAARDIFTAVAEAATVMGLTGEQTAGALNAIQQMISKGNVSAEELRQQLGERLPGALQLAARAMGVTTVELNKMLDRGELTAADLLPRLAVELRKTFGPEVERAAQGTQQQFNRLETAIFELKTAAGDALAPAIGQVAKALAELARNEEVVGSMVALGRAMAAVIVYHVQMFERAMEVVNAFREMNKAIQDTGASFAAFAVNLMKHSPDLLRVAAALGLVAQQAREAREESQKGVRSGGQRLYVSATPRFQAPAGPTLDDAIDRAWKAEIARLKEAAAESKRYQEAVEELTASLGRELQQNEALTAALADGEPAYLALKREIEATNAVIAAGIDPTSSLGRALVEMGEEAALAGERLELALKKLDLQETIAELRERVSLMRELMAAVEGGAVGALPAPTGTGDIDIGPGDVDWGALEAGYREFFGNAEQIHENYLEGLQRSFGDAFRDLFRSGEVSFKDFFRSVADVGINLFAEQLSAALTAALEGVEGAWRNLTKAMSSGAGQMAGWMTAAGIVAGAQNTDYAAIGAVLGAVVGGIAGAGVWSWATAALGASVGAWLGSMVKKGSPAFFGAIEAELGKIQIGVSDLGGGAKAVAKAFQDDLQEAMTRILEQIGGTLEGIGGGISLKMKDDKLSVFIDGLEHRFKEDIEGGISFALTEALKRADISGASATFVQILERTTAKSLEQLSDALDWGRWYERLRLGDVAADLQDRMFKFGQDIRRAIEFGLDTSFITIDLASDFEAYRNQILGIVESEEERIRRQAEAFNQWRAITQAEQLARQADLIIRKADLDAEIALLKASMAIDESHLNFRKEMLDADLQISTAEWELLDAKLQALAAVEQALAVVEGILASLPDLISGTEIEDAVKRARGGRGGQRKADLDAVQQMLEDAADALLPEFAQALKAINDKWDEAVLKAHENADLLDEIAAAREREIAALREQRLLDFGAELSDFLSGGGSGSSFVDAVHALQDRIAELGADLGSLAEDLGLTAHEMLFFWQAVLAGQKEMERKLATEGFLGLVRGLAELTQDQQLRHELLMQAATIEFDLKMAQYQLEFDMLQALGYLTAEQIALIDEALGNIAANRDLIIRSQVPIPGAGGGAGPDPADERARALARLRDIQARSLDPFSQAIRSVVDEFAELRRVLGWTSEVQAVYAAEIQRVLMEQLEPIRRLQDELAFRSDSPMRSLDQFRLAQRNLNEAVAALRGGDLSQLEAIPDLARMVLDLNPSSQASEASRFLFEMVDRILDEAAAAAESAVSGIVPGTATDPWTWLRDTPSAGDELIAQTIRDLGRDLGSGLDDVETSIHVGTGGIEDKLPFDWSLVGVNAGPADNPTPPPDDGPRRIAAESREIEALQRLREIAARTASMDDAIRSGSLGVRASVG